MGPFRPARLRSLDGDPLLKAVGDIKIGLKIKSVAARQLLFSRSSAPPSRQVAGAD